MHVLFSALIVVLVSSVSVAPAAQDGSFEENCMDAAICLEDHGLETYERDWADVLAEVKPFLPGLRSPCWVDDAGSPRCLPAMMLAGFPKCGTTTMYAKLMHHPRMAASKLKEPHWFTRSEIGHRNFSRYLDMWPSAGSVVSLNKMTFEASASTLWDRGWRNPRLKNMLLPEVLSRLLPTVKLLVMVREPTARIWSEFKYFYKGKLGSEQFHKGLDEAFADWNRCRARRSVTECVMYTPLQMRVPRLPVGAYSVFLRIWHRYFDSSQIMVVSSERLMSHPREVYAAIFDFLGLEDPGTQVF
jgi:N-acetylgalactosamine 4-sulfate 6-O-sulfotransferase